SSPGWSVLAQPGATGAYSRNPSGWSLRAESWGDARARPKLAAKPERATVPTTAVTNDPSATNPVSSPRRFHENAAMVVSLHPRPGVPARRPAGMGPEDRGQRQGGHGPAEEGRGLRGGIPQG